MRVRFSLPAPFIFDGRFAIKFCPACGHKTDRQIPDGDTKERDVCGQCATIHYHNPKIVVGAIPVFEGKILLCKRAIEPRLGFWTLPAGFMELGESMAEGAARETWEEALAKVEIGRLFASVDVVQAGQVHVFFEASFNGEFGVGDESLDTALFSPDDIPWSELAFPSGRFALEKHVDHDASNRETYLHSAKRIKIPASSS